MNFRRWLLALGAFFSLAVVIAGCGSSAVPSGSVVNVSGNAVTTRAFNHWMYIAAKGQTQSSPGAPLVVANDPPDFKNCISQVRKEVPQLAKASDKQLKATCKQLFTSESGQVLDFLIRAYWYQAYAAKHHVSVSNSAVQTAFNHDKASQFGSSPSGFQSFLTQSGQTVQDVLYRVRVNLIYQKLVNKELKPVSNSEISAYYAAHASQFGTPESRDLRIVLTKTKSAANAAKSALANGQSWTTVAKRYSMDSATKNKGGELNNVTAGQQDQGLDKAAFSAPVGKLEGPIKSQFGYYLVEVRAIHKATQQSLAKVRSTIKQTLTTQARQTAQTSVDNAARKEYLSKTKCLSAYMMSDCSGYKPPKTSTGSQTAPGG
ncbi:MAG TPA: peptidyl-prolyl cis-trans isomerase [Solirubrobacteraceae bacterium]|nr:peptidyl-prolyl cis-trans isomerase [Solirubrobacteraceae bacterium]